MASAGVWGRVFATCGRGASTRGKFSLGVAAAIGSLGSADAVLRCHEAPAGGHSHRSSSSIAKKRTTRMQLRENDPSASLVFGVPNKGQLHEEVKALLHGAGIGNLPVSIVFLPSAEIATRVRKGDVDIGITGEHVVAESKDIKMVLPLEACTSANISLPDEYEQTFLISNPDSKHQQLIEVLRRRIAGHIAETTWVNVTYNVERAKLPLAEKITSGKRSLSIVPLEDSNWVAVTAPVMQGYVPGIMDQLQFVGAQDVILSE